MAPLAISTGIQIAYVVGLVVVLFLGPVTVAEMKGHDFLVGFGWLTLGVTWWVAAFKLARPESWWGSPSVRSAQNGASQRSLRREPLHLDHIEFRSTLTSARVRE
jgi:hypothetical protein